MQSTGYHHVLQRRTQAGATAVLKALTPKSRARADPGDPGGLTPARSSNRYAYVFYATNNVYATAVLVFVRRLQVLGIRSDTDLVVLHLPLSRRLLAKMREMGMRTVEVEQLRYVYAPYYRDCLTKLRIFQLAQYDRVVFVDADALPVRSLDPLLSFQFDGPVAAPRAYWLPQPYWTSALLVVRPSADAWNRVSSHFRSAYEQYRYDMEIINAEFGDEICSLPVDTFCLNSEWEDVNRQGFFDDFDEAFSRVSVVHFTALGKPWSYSSRRVRRLRPNAHPIFYELWETWRRTREEIW